MIFQHRFGRFLAVTRSRVPSLFFIPGVIGGQLLAEYLSLYSLLGALWIVGLLSLGIQYRNRCAPSWTRFSLLLVTVSTGLVSVVPQKLHQSEIQIGPWAEKPMLVSVLDEPRRPRVGEVRFTASILGVLVEQGDRRVFKNFHATEKKIACRAVDLPWRNIARVTKGNHYIIRARISPISDDSNPFSWNRNLRRHGIFFTCQVRYASLFQRAHPSRLKKLHRRWIDSIQGIVGTGEAAGLLRALAFGDRDVLTTRTERAFQMTGLTHVLVVSGYQISLIFLLFSVLVRRGCGIVAPAFDARVASFISGSLMSVLFVALIGAENSNIRALVALLCYMAATLRESPHTLFNALLVTFLLIILIFPLGFLEPSIQLTFAALLGITIGASSQITGWRAYLYTSVCASICTSVIASLWFSHFSVLGLILNPILAPLLSILGCQGTFLALGCFELGIDQYGLLLSGVSALLEYGRDVVVFCASLEEHYFNPAIFYRSMLCLGVGAYILYVSMELMRQEKRKYNL